MVGFEGSKGPLIKLRRHHVSVVGVCPRQNDVFTGEIDILHIAIRTDQDGVTRLGGPHRSLNGAMVLD